jgi:type IV pilus assembly protein PilX
MKQFAHLFNRRQRRSATQQGGASLLFALITLVALALAATALVRAVDTGAVVLGNLGAKKATTIAADRATQLAIRFLFNKGTEANRNADDPNNGYYASAKDDFDFTGYGGTDPNRKLVNWDVDGSCAYATAGGVCDSQTRPNDAQTIDTAAKLEARWVITRLCSTANMAHTDNNNNCAMPPKVGFRVDDGTGLKDYGNIQQKIEAPTPFYRIVVRVTGPRNAVTYTETIVHLPLT